MKGSALLLLSCLASGFLQIKSQGVHGKSLIDDQFKDGGRLCYSFLYCGPTESCKFDKPTKECIRFDDEDFVKNIMTSFFKAIIKGNEVLKIFFPSGVFDLKDSSEEILRPTIYPPFYKWAKKAVEPLEEEPTTVETTSQLPKLVSASYPILDFYTPSGYPYWNPYYNTTWQHRKRWYPKYTTATRYRMSLTTPSPSRVNEENKSFPGKWNRDIERSTWKPKNDFDQWEGTERPGSKYRPGRKGNWKKDLENKPSSMSPMEFPPDIPPTGLPQGMYPPGMIPPTYPPGWSVSPPGIGRNRRRPPYYPYNGQRGRGGRVNSGNKHPYFTRRPWNKGPGIGKPLTPSDSPVTDVPGDIEAGI